MVFRTRQVEILWTYKSQERLVWGPLHKNSWLEPIQATVSIQWLISSQKTYHIKPKWQQDTFCGSMHQISICISLNMHEHQQPKQGVAIVISSFNQEETTDPSWKNLSLWWANVVLKMFYDKHFIDQLSIGLRNLGYELKDND